MNRRIGGLALGAVMAVVGTIVLVVFVRGAEDRALEGETVVRVLTATETIPAGTPAEQVADLTTVERIPEKIAPPGALSDLGPVAGFVTATEILAGETLLSGRFVQPNDFSAARSPSAIEVPEGMLEITMALSQEQFIGGVPVPGDRVAVIVNGLRGDFLPGEAAPAIADVDDTGQRFAKIVLQQALVTNVQGNPLPEAPAAISATERVAPATGSLLVTLALDGPDIERLVYIRDSQSLNADLHLALHSGDALVATEGIGVENVIDPGAPVG